MLSRVIYNMSFDKSIDNSGQHLDAAKLVLLDESPASQSRTVDVVDAIGLRRRTP